VKLWAVWVEALGDGKPAFVMAHDEEQARELVLEWLTREADDNGDDEPYEYELSFLREDVGLVHYVG
jgi:hypothetical protein